MPNSALLNKENFITKTKEALAIRSDMEIIKAITVLLAFSLLVENSNVPKVNFGRHAKKLGKNIVNKGVPSILGGAAVGGVMGAIDSFMGEKDDTVIHFSPASPPAAENDGQVVTIVVSVTGTTVTFIILFILRFIWMKWNLHRLRLARSTRQARPVSRTNTSRRGGERRCRSLSASSVAISAV